MMGDAVFLVLVGIEVFDLCSSAPASGETPSEENAS